MMKFTFEGSKGERLDQVLLAKLHSRSESAQLTRSQLKQLISEGKLRIDGKVVKKAGYALRVGQKIEFDLDALLSNARADELTPYEFKLDILFEDEQLMVLNKPPGLTVHPGAGNPDKTLANALISHLGREGKFIARGAKLLGNRPGIVHRLDKDTSGVMVVAKDAVSHDLLSKQFAKRTVRKFYLALVHSGARAASPVRTEDYGVVDAKIARHPLHRTRMSVSAKGRDARTAWRVIGRGKEACLLIAQPHTGRTHQIRVHMHHLKAALIGDPLYKSAAMLTPQMEKCVASFGRQALHAYKLEFDHPQTGQRLSFCAKLPKDFEALLSAFGIDTKFGQEICDSVE